MAAAMEAGDEGDEVVEPKIKGSIGGLRRPSGVPTALLSVNSKSNSLLLLFCKEVKRN